MLELHGSVYRNYCTKCREKYSLEYLFNYPEPVPKCRKCGGIVRPDVTLYEEDLDMRVVSKAVSHIKKADMLIVGGTSLSVHPAAGLIYYYKGDRLVLINKSSTSYDQKANLIISDSIGKMLDKLAFSLRK